MKLCHFTYSIKTISPINIVQQISILPYSYTPKSCTSFCALRFTWLACMASSESKVTSSWSAQSWWVCTVVTYFEEMWLVGNFCCHRWNVHDMVQTAQEQTTTLKAGTRNLKEWPEKLTPMRRLQFLNKNKHTQRFPLLSWQLVLNHQKGANKFISKAKKIEELKKIFLTSSLGIT